MNRCPYISCNRVGGHFCGDLFQFVLRVSKATNDRIADGIPYATAGKLSICTGKVLIGIVLD